MHNRIQALLFLFLVVVGAGSVCAQELSREEMLPIFKSLGEEDWDNAFAQANKLLTKFPSDTIGGVPLLNYISIFSAAGRVTKGNMTYAELEKHVKKFVGHRLTMSAHPTTTDTVKVAFSTTILKKRGDRVIGENTSANRAATNIFAFEYFDFDEDFPIEDWNGLTSRCGGILEKVEFNPNKSMIWVMRLHVKNAWIHEFQPAR
ncbi:MAG: hypothetical protein Q8896_07010 [Bacteroidota bacterium]|nr:hypothetical protein [Bacteroidota bacterium]